VLVEAGDNCPMVLSETRKGEWYVTSAALLGGFFPIVVVFTYASVSSLISLAWSTLFAAGLFAILLTYRARWVELRDPAVWKYGFFSALFIGVLFYVFYFMGLEHTTPGNASIIVLLQILTSFLFFNMYRKEYFSREYKLGAILMVVGAVIILAPNFGGINIGDFFILGSALFAPIGNFFQQEGRKIASSETIMFLRSALSAAALFLVIYLWSIPAEAADIRAVLPFLILNGIVLLGFEKVLWIEGIHRISVTKATALVSMTPFITLLFAWLLLHQAPTLWQLLSLAPFVLGTLLLTDQVHFRRTIRIQ